MVFIKHFISCARCTWTSTLSGSEASAEIKKNPVVSFGLDVWVEETVPSRRARTALSPKQSLVSHEDGGSTFLLTCDKYISYSLASRL